MGFFIEPNVMQSFNITLGLSSGPMLSQSVNGDGGAQFFGWVGTDVTSFTVTAPSTADGFGMGDFFSSTHPHAIPGPTIGAGLPGLIAACGGLLVWWLRTRRTQAVV
jgi:hypothetical protein